MKGILLGSITDKVHGSRVHFSSEGLQGFLSGVSLLESSGCHGFLVGLVRERNRFGDRSPTKFMEAMDMFSSEGGSERILFRVSLIKSHGNHNLLAGLVRERIFLGSITDKIHGDHEYFQFAGSERIPPRGLFDKKAWGSWFFGRPSP